MVRRFVRTRTRAYLSQGQDARIPTRHPDLELTTVRRFAVRANRNGHLQEIGWPGFAPPKEKAESGDRSAQVCDQPLREIAHVSENYRFTRYALDTLSNRSTRLRRSTACLGTQKYPSRTPKNALRIRRFGVRIPPNTPSISAGHPSHRLRHNVATFLVERDQMLQAQTRPGPAGQEAAVHALRNRRLVKLVSMPGQGT